MQRHTLEKRLTHKYVGEYAYEDSWEYLGSFYEEGRDHIIHNDDPDCETPEIEDPRTTVLFGRVVLDEDALTTSVLSYDVAHALEDTFTNVGCTCEHDCCGCRSPYATATHIGGDYWKVEIRSSINV